MEANQEAKQVAADPLDHPEAEANQEANQVAFRHRPVQPPCLNTPSLPHHTSSSNVREVPSNP